MITYLLQLTICWLLFYAAYYFLLREETHFTHNRWYLLSALLLGLVIPLVDWASYFPHQPESLGHIYIAPFTDQMAQWDITVTAESQDTNWYQVFLIIYVIGCAIAAFRLLHSWLRIRRIRSQSRLIDHDHYTLVLTDQKHLPFSFLGDVYCSSEFFRTSPDIDQILAHEELHIRARHSLDVIFTEILKILFWFHPLIYIYKIELQQIHEYQADHAAYQLTSRKRYGKILLHHVESLVPMYLANHFFNSQLKNRFKMMTKKTSNKQSVWKYAVMVPLIAMTILAFSYSSQGKSLLNSVIILQDTVPPPPPPAPLPPPPPPPASVKDGIHVVGYPLKKGEEIPPPPPPAPPVVDKVVTGQASTGAEEIFRVVEEMPRFPGCEELADDPAAAKKCADQKMLEFLYTNIKYPAIARSSGVEGNVVVQFIVEKDGSIAHPKVVRDPGAMLGEEAVRIVNLMAEKGKWTPGKQRGQNVRVAFILPIKFELDKSKAATEPVKVRLHSADHGERTQPLFILDDVVLGRLVNNEINESIDPNDIESINVLKGEAAVEKYGPEGQDGVIEIYTKWGKNNQQPELNLTGVNLYPVPVSNQLNFTSGVESQGKYEIEIRDLTGRIMKEKDVQVNADRIETSIGLDGLLAGAYYLVVSHQGKVFSKAFVKQ